MSIFGHSAFVHGGVGGLAVGCFASSNCSASATIRAGRTVIARTGREAIGQNSGGTLYFTLSGAGRSMLARARSHQLGVNVSVRNADGATTSSNLNLISYGTTGKGPATSISQSSNLKILAHSVFVSPSGVGGIFVGCGVAAGCHPSATLSVGSTVIAHSGSEYVGGQDCGTVYFTLSSAGRSMLAHTRSNQLAAVLSLSDGSSKPSAHVAVIGFH